MPSSRLLPRNGAAARVSPAMLASLRQVPDIWTAVPEGIGPESRPWRGLVTRYLIEFEQRRSEAVRAFWVWRRTDSGRELLQHWHEELTDA